MKNYNNLNLIDVNGNKGNLAIKIGNDIFPVNNSNNNNNNQSINFYKCTSVDITNSTWAGYKVILNSETGSYTFESNITSGLSYIAIRPILNKIYSTDALILITSVYTDNINPEIPLDYIVYHPLTSPLSNVNGYNCNYNNVTFEFDSSLGKTVATFNGNESIRISNITGSSTISFSIWQKLNQNNENNQIAVWFLPNFYMFSTLSFICVGDEYGRSASYTFLNIGWHHFYVDYNIDNNNIRLFIDGEYVASGTAWPSFNTTLTLVFGLHENGSSYPLTGNLKAFRMYNRILNTSLITALASEFI